MGNWYFENGEAYWENMIKFMINERDDEMKNECIRLFEETRS